MKKYLFFLLLLFPLSLLASESPDGWGSGGGNGYVCFKEDHGPFTGKEIVQYLFRKIKSDFAKNPTTTATLNLSGLTDYIKQLEMLEMGPMRRLSRATGIGIHTLFKWPTSKEKFSREKRLAFQIGVVFEDIKNLLQVAQKKRPQLKKITQAWLRSANTLENLLMAEIRKNPNIIQKPLTFRYVRDVEEYEAPLIDNNVHCIDITLVKQNVYWFDSPDPFISVETNLHFLQEHMDYQNQFLLWLHETLLLTERLTLKRHNTEKVRELGFRLLLKDEKQSDLVNWLKKNGYAEFVLPQP